MSRKIALIASSVLLAAGLFSMNACTSGSSTASSSNSTNSYTGAGSRWGATLNGDLTFIINHYANAGDTTSDMTITGTYEMKSLSFLILTVGSCTKPGGSAQTCPSNGTTAYGFEIPGVAFLVKPIGGNGNVISMIGQATCPTSSFNANYMKVKVETTGGWDTHNNDVFGTFNYVPGTGATVPSRFALDATSLSSENLTNASCAGGLMTFTDGGGHEADIFLNSSGGALVHTGVGAGAGGDGVIVGLPQPSSGVTISSLAGTYGGIAFINSSNVNFPVSVSLAAGGGGVNGTGSEIDVTTGSPSGSNSAHLVLNNVTGLPNGFVTGTVTTGGSSQTEPLACMVEQNIGPESKTVLVCAAVDSGAGAISGGSPGTGTNFFSIVLVSQ
jgi:hypothetical protein